MNSPTRTPERKVFLRGVSLPLTLAEALIADARRAGDGLGDAIERAIGQRAACDHGPTPVVVDPKEIRP